MALFGGKGTGAGLSAVAPKVPRYSSGWVQLGKHLRSRESLRILDIGPTSASNINFITALGHSVYMANLVEDAARPEYLAVPAGGAPGDVAVFDTARYLRDNLEFSGRQFDVVTFWDTADYLPKALIAPVIERIYEVMEPGGQLLAFFHSKATGDDTVFSRYHLTAGDQLDVQKIGSHTMRQSYTTREVETLFQRFSSNKFFLAKDALREVLVVR